MSSTIRHVTLIFKEHECARSADAVAHPMRAFAQYNQTTTQQIHGREKRNGKLANTHSYRRLGNGVCGMGPGSQASHRRRRTCRRVEFPLSALQSDAGVELGFPRGLA